jgi:hypothetical protein
MQSAMRWGGVVVCCRRLLRDGGRGGCGAAANVPGDSVLEHV